MIARAALTWGRADWGTMQTPTEVLSEAGIDRYRRDLRSFVRGLWTGVMDTARFIASVTDAVERAVMTAWREGAAKAGVKEDELTPDELAARDQAMWNQWMHVAGFAEFVDANSRANGGNLETCLNRADLWVNQYNSASVKAEAMAAGDMKAVWVLGPTEHCPTCAKLNGKVKRMSYWVAHVLPQNAPNPRLSCGGWRCQCTLQKTDLPLSKGRLPGV